MQDEEGFTALMVAAESAACGGERSAEAMRVLLDAGADANKQNKFGSTALMYAARFGGEHAAGMMRLLAGAGADVDHQNKYGWTALMQAARSGVEHGAGMMKVLVEAGANANTQTKIGWTALMWAARDGGEHGAAMMEVLLDAGAAVDAQRKDGATALMLTAEHGEEHAAGMMRVLLDAGADANTQSENGWTALMYAARHGGVHGAGMMEVLTGAGAAVNEQAEGGWTALTLAAASQGGEHAMRLLVAHGATLPSVAELLADTPPAHAEYIRGAQKWTPLHRAADARDLSALFALLRERTPPHERHDDAVDSPHADMRTALAIAASESYPCAAPVDERCVALLRSGAVWSIAHHALCPADERMAASARALMLGVRRWDVQGDPYEVDIGSARGRDGAERQVPREIWLEIFTFLLFEEGHA